MKHIRTVEDFADRYPTFGYVQDLLVKAFAIGWHIGVIKEEYFVAEKGLIEEVPFVHFLYVLVDDEGALPFDSLENHYGIVHRDPVHLLYDYRSIIESLSAKEEVK